jgi:prephenate dehydrogenase
MLAREHVMGLIGFGEIGRHFTKALSENQLKNHRLGAAMTRRNSPAELQVSCV